MATAAKLTAVDACREGAYLTDGERLFRVLPDGADGRVWLEDSGFPDSPPQEFVVQEVVRRMRLVRPAGDGA